MSKALLVFVLALMAAQVTAPAQAKLRIVTTLPSFADIAARVGGDEVSAETLTQGNQDPHFVDAKPDLILKLNRADLVIRAGLGLEDGWLPVLVTGARNSKVLVGSAGNLDASTLVTLKEVPQGKVDRSAGDVHPGGNPHYMLDPRNGVLVAQGIAARLSKLDPSKATEFGKRAEAYVSELKAKIAEWEKAHAPGLKGRPVVTYHRSWIYFTGWVGLNEIEHVEPKPGVPPSPSHVVRLVSVIKAAGAGVPILIEPFYPKTAAEDIATKAGAQVMVLPSEVQKDAPTYISVFEAIFKKLKGDVLR